MHACIHIYAFVYVCMYVIRPKFKYVCLFILTYFYIFEFIIQCSN